MVRTLDLNIDQWTILGLGHCGKPLCRVNLPTTGFGIDTRRILVSQGVIDWIMPIIAPRVSKDHNASRPCTQWEEINYLRRSTKSWSGI